MKTFDGILKQRAREAKRHARHGDDRVTVRMAREVLAEASCWLPLYPYSRRVRGSGPSRIQWWRMCLNFASNDKEPDSLLHPIYARRLRESFGVDGRKRGRKTPPKPRKAKRLERWPVLEEE